MRVILVGDQLHDAGRCTHPDPLLRIAIYRHRNGSRRSAKRKAADRPIIPIKEPGRSNEEHASDAIFSEGRSDVAGDHACFGKNLNLSVNEALHAILSCNPKYALSVLAHRTNAFVEFTCTLADIDGAGRSAMEDAASVRADPKIVVATIKHG